MGREEILQNVPIFSELGRRDLERLGRLMVPRQVRAGEVIIKQGDQAAGFFVINRGKVEVVQDADGSNPQRLATLGEGDFFGEMALFEGFPRNATVRGTKQSLLYVLGEDDFRQAVASSDSLREELHKVLFERQ